MSVSWVTYHSRSGGQLSIVSWSRAIDNRARRICGRALPDYIYAFKLQSSAVARENPLPSRNAHATIAITAIDRQTLARSHFVGPFYIHQLHRSLQSLHRRSAYKGRTTSLRVAARPVAVFFLLDVRVFAAYFRV